MPTVKKFAKRKPGKPAARRTVSRGPSYDIPESLNVPPADFFEYGTLIYGLKGIGKSTLAAQYPDPFLLMAEPGRRSLRVRMVPKPKDPPLDWDAIVGYTQSAINDRRVKTIIYDTVDRVFLACQNKICDEKGIKHPNEAKDFGQTTSEIKGIFGELMDSVKLAGKTPLWLSHCAVREVYDALSDTKMEKLVPSCASGPWAYLQAAADFVFCYLRRGVERTLVVRGTETIEASCGPECFLHPKSGKPLAEIPMGSSPAESFRNLCAGYRNELSGRILVPPVKTDESDTTTEDPLDSRKPTKKKFKLKKKG